MAFLGQPCPLLLLGMALVLNNVALSWGLSMKMISSWPVGVNHSLLTIDLSFRSGQDKRTSSNVVKTTVKRTGWSAPATADGSRKSNRVFLQCYKLSVEKKKRIAFNLHVKTQITSTQSPSCANSWFLSKILPYNGNLYSRLCFLLDYML